MNRQASLSSCHVVVLAVDEGWEVEADKVERRLTHRGDISSVMHDRTLQAAGFEHRHSEVVGTDVLVYQSCSV